MSVRLGNNIIAGAGGGGGGGAVDSVNGKTGVVVLDASDVGALPDSTSIPTESTVSSWGFTKNEGTVTSVNNVQPTNGNVTLNIPIVNDSTITVTQGGVTKGTFTLNQANASTIALDAGAPGNYHPDLFDYKWADHICNDVQWLRADTFSWQSGAVYQVAYNHLIEDLEELTPAWTWLASGVGSLYTAHRNPSVGDKAYSDTDLTVEAGDITEVTSGSITVNSTIYNINGRITGNVSTETVAGITIDYYQSSDGHKIVIANQNMTKAEQIYAATGSSWYYILDYMNQRFKLPRRHSQQVVRSVKNADGSWYRLYADSWVEQGGVEIASGAMITLPIAMADTKYTVQTTPTWGTASSSGTRGMCSYLKTTTSFNAQQDNNSGSFDWQVSGQSAIDMSSFQDGEKYLYFYVGEFTQSAIVNTAGLNAELFNTKADVSTVATATAHVVTEFQEPTSANNYIWYRKYNDGWVEQGGPQSTINTTINLPVEMADTNYAVDCGIHIANYGDQTLTKRTTSFSTGSVVTNVGTTGGWTVKGMAA